MRGRSIRVMGLLGMLVSTWPASGLTQPVVFAIVQDRIYRAGVFLVVDALVENKSTRKVEAAEVSVEFYTFFDELVRVEHTPSLPRLLSDPAKLPRCES